MARLTRLGHQSLAVTLSILLFLQPAIANAQTVSASTTAPAANQPTVGTVPNGKPLIDIVTPNASGLSHNKYDNFNVGTQGLILNNFNGESGTSNLGGATPGNPNLRNSGPASVILNEVTSGNRSALNGQTEVFGGRADVVIANPNGITCNNCGFINTPRAMLTTGVPNIGADGSLSGFTVNGGDVTFEGAGTNLTTAPGAVDLFDVVARNIHVNAPVFGKTIRLTGGASQYNYATGESTALTATSGTPEYAIDGTALGAMQADRIKVVVTEKGAGVKMSGDMAANAGELSLSADGKISIGNASGRDGVTISSKQRVTAAKVTSRQKVKVQADQGISLQSIAADSDIVLASGAGLLSVSGDVNSGTSVQMSSDGGIAAGSVTTGTGAATLSATSGDIAIAGAANSTGDLTLTTTAGAISAASLQSGQNITLNANLGATVAGNVQAQGNVTAAGRSISVGKVISGIDIAATSANPSGNVVLGAAGSLSLTATAGDIATGNLLSAGSLNATANGNITAGSIQSANDLTIMAASLAASGVTSHGALTVDAAGGLVDVSGQVLAASNVLISGSALQADAIAAGVDFAATDANGGSIVLGSSGTLGLTATAGNVVADKLLSAGDFTARAAQLQANNIASHGNVAIAASGNAGIGGGVNVANQLLGAGNVTISSNTSGVGVGLLASGVDFAATKAAGGNIVLAGSGDLTINDSAGAIQAGTMLAAGAINATGQTVTAETITGHKDITLSGATSAAAGSGRVNVSGQVLGAGNVSISGSAIKADAIVSGVDIATTDAAGGRITLGPTITGTGNLTLAASDALNAGTLLSAGDLNASGAMITASNISAHHDMTLGGVISVGGQILGAGNVSIIGPSLSAQSLVAGLDFNATDAANGKIILGQKGDLAVSVNGAVNSPTIQAAGVLNVSGASVTADSITGHQNVTLAGATTVNNQVLGGGNVSVAGPSIKAGSVVSGVDFVRTAAANGSIVLSSSGDLTLSAANALNIDSLLSAGGLSATASNLTANNVTAHGDMTLGGAINVTQQILGAGNVLISGQSLSAQTVVAGIDFSATNAAGGNIALGQTGDLKVAASGSVTVPAVQAAGTIDIRSAAVTSDAITGHKDITVAAVSGPMNVTNQVLGGGKIGISGSSIKASAIISGVDFAATAAANGHIVQTASGDLTLASTGNINAGTLLSAGRLGAAGTTVTANAVTAHGDMALAGAINVNSQILSSGNVLISGQGLSAQTLVAGIDFSATNAAGGNIVLGQSGDLKVTTSDVVAVPTIQAAGVIDISGTSIAADAITGHKDITLSGTTGTTTASGRVDVSNQVLGGGNVGISGSAIKASAIISGVDFAATAAANGHIVQTASGDLILGSSGAIDVGTLLSASDLIANGTTITAGNISAHHDMTLGGAISVSGQILGARNISISGPSLLAQSLVAGLDFNATDAANGKIALGPSGDLKVATSGVVTVPTVQAAGTIDIRAASVTSDAVTGHKDITVSATSGPVDVTDQVLGGGSVNLSGSAINASAIISGVDFAAAAAANGHIVQTASGDISLTSPGSVGVGTLLSAGNLIASGSTITADGITAHGAVTLGGAISVTDQILGSGNVSITGQSLSAQTVVAGIDFDATNRAGGNIVLGQTGDLTITAGGAVAAPTMQAVGSINVSGAAINSNAVTGHGNIALSGSTTVTSQVLGGGNVSISGSSIKAGAVVSGIDFASTAASAGGIVLAGSGDMTLASSGNINADTLLSAGALDAAGITINANAVTAHGDMTLAGAINVNSQILSSGNVLISGQSLSARTVVAGLDFGATDAAGGNIVLGQTGDLKVTANGAVAVPTIQAAGAIDINAASVTSDAMTGHKDITVSGASGPVNVANQVLGGGNISLTGSAIKASGIVSGIDFTRTAAANGHIVQTASGDISLRSLGAISVGTLLSAGNLNASGSTVTADGITAHGVVTLGGAISVTDQILGSGNVSITGQSLSAQTVVAGIDLDATNSAGGNIVLGQSGNLAISVDGTVAAPTMQAAGSINARGATINANAVTSHGNITLSGSTTVNSQVLGGGNIAISGPGIKVGTVVSGVDFARTASANGNIVQTASGDLTLSSTGSIDGGTLLSAGAFSASGITVTADAVTAHGDITLKGIGATATSAGVNIAGQVLASGNVLISGQSLSAQTVIAGIDFDATNRVGGNIVLGQSGDLTVNVNGAVTAPTIQAAGAIDVGGASVAAASITGHKDVSLSGTAVGGVTVVNQVLGGGNIGISGSSIQAGTIVSGVDFAATSANGGNIVQTSSGDISLTSSGNISGGTLLSAGNLNASGSTVGADSITAHGAVTLNGAVSIANQILGSGNISIKGQSLSAQTIVSGIDFDATDAGGGNIVLGQAGDLEVSVNGGIAASTVQAAGAVNAGGATLTANAITAHKDITLSANAAGGVAVTNQVLGGGNVGISGSSIKAGAIVSGVDFARTAAADGNIVLASSGDLTLVSAGNIDTGTLLSAGALSANGAAVNANAVTAHGTMTLKGATTVSGQVLGASDVLITGQSLSAQSVVAGIDFAATDAAGGNIVLGRTADLTARLSGGFSASTVEVAGATDVNAASVTADSVTGHKDIALAGTTTVHGQILGGGNINVSGPSITAGAIVSGVDFIGTAAANGNIAQTSSGDMSLASSGNLTIGTLLSAGNLIAQASDLNASSITGHGNTNLKASGRVGVSGQVLSARDLTITANSLGSGLLISGVDFAATNGSGGNIVLAPSGAMNLAVSGNATAGTMLSAGDVTADAGNLQANSITSHGKVGIVGNVDVSNQILAAGDLTISGGSISAPTLISGIDFAATNAAGGNIVLASPGAMNLTASGNITAGTILSAGDFTAKAANLTAASITSHGNVDIFGNLAATNQVISADELAISGGSISAPVLISGVDFAATNAAGGGIVLGTAATIAGNRAGDMNLTASAGITAQTMLSAGAIAASGTAITANTITGHGDITLAGSSVNVTGQLLGAGDVLLSGSTVQLGQAVTGVDFAATARSSNGAIALGPSGDLTINAGSASASMLIVAGGLNVAANAFTGGNITGHGAVAIGSSTSPGAIRINGQLLGASNVSLIGSAVSGNVIAAGVDFDATSQSATGNIVLGQAGDLTLAAAAGDISFNSLLAAGTISANAANNVSANAVAHGDLTLTASNAITLLGQSLGTGNVNLNARSISIDTLVSGVDFAATNASGNRSLMLRRAGAMTLAASNGSISANSLLSGGNLSAAATQNISYNSLQSLGNAALTSPGAIAYTSTTRVGGNLTLNTGALDLSGSRGSRISGGGTLIVNAASANLSGSNLVFGGLNLNLSGGADLSNAQVSTVANAGGSGDITISAAGLATTAGTSLLAAHDLTLNLPSLGNTGQLAAGNSLTFNVSGDFYNSPSGLVFAGNNANLFVGGTLTNDQGAMLSGNGLTVAGPGGGQRNGAVVNSAGLIQSGGTMSILTNGLSNVTTSAPAIQRNVLMSDDILHAYDLIDQSGGATSLVHQLMLQDQLISGAGASGQIRAGRDLTINATNLWNGYSSIKSDGNMLLTVAGTLTNDGATLNRITEATCSSSTPCQYYPDKTVETTTLNCSGPNRPCIENTTTTYEPNPNGTRDPSKDLNPGTTVTGVAVIGAISGVIEARGGLTINGGGAVNNVASNGSIAGQVAIDAPATANNPLGALNSMTAGGALFSVSAALSNVAANGGASANSGPSLAGSGPTIGAGPAISSGNLRASGGPSISGGSLTANGNAAVSNHRVTAATGPSVSGGDLAVANGVSISGNSLTAAGSASIGSTGVTAVTGAAITGNSVTAAAGPAINGGAVTAAAGTSINGNGVTAAAGPSISGNTLTAGNASVSPNSLMGKLTAAIGNSGNLTQILQTNGAQLAALAKPQSGGVGGTVPGQVFLFETRAAFLDVSKFYGSAYFIDRIGYTPETKVPFLGDAYFDNQLIDEQMRQLVGDGLGAGSFVPGNNATDQMKTLLDNGVAYAAANGLGLGQALTPQQAASLTQSMVIYQTEIVDGAPVLVPVVYLSAADRAKVTSAATIAGNTVSIDAASVVNSGAIAAVDGMTINAGSIKANGGAFLAGGNMNLNAENGITLAAQTMNIGGQTIVTANGGVTAGGNLKMDAGAGSLALSGTKVAARGSAQLSGQTVTLGAVKQDNGGVQTLVGTTVTTGGNLSIAGTNGVNIIASSAKVGGDLSVASASGSVSIISAGVQNTTVDISRGTTLKTTSLTQQASSLTAGGAMLVSGNQGVLIGGSTLVTGGNLGIVSTNGNIAITASQDQTTSQSKTIAGAANGYKGGQSSSAGVTSNASSITSQNGNVTVQADTGNISVIGSDIDAKGGTANLIAKGDVTIGEATDSASSSSQSGSRKATETTTTAQGSSISGQTGVNIASTGGNVTVSASDVTAGDAAHTAKANISAAGNIVIASGKDTKETTSDSKKSGFLSSSKTHTHTYDEDTVGSSVSASGDVTVNAGSAAVVSGSNIAAGGSLSLSGSTVTVMGAEEEHESDKQTKKSGIGVGSGGGFISIYGSHSKSITESSTDNVGSALSAANGNITLNATKGDLNIIGSSVSAGQDINLSAARDVNVTPGAESASKSEQDKRSGFGIQLSLGQGSASIGVGYGSSTDKTSKASATNAASTLAASRDVNINAGNDVNLQAAKVDAGRDANLFAANDVNLLSAEDQTNYAEMHQRLFAGISLNVSSGLISAGQSIASAAGNLGGPNSQYALAPAALAGYQTYNTLDKMGLLGGAASQPLASTSLTIGFTSSKTEQSTTVGTPVVTTIDAGRNATIVAKSGDIISRGAQITAGSAGDVTGGNVLLWAGRNIDLESAQAFSTTSASSQSAGAFIGIDAGGLTAGGSYAKGGEKATGVTQVNSHVLGTGNVTTVSGGDTTLAGAVVSGNSVSTIAGGDLNIVSRQDTATYDEKTLGASLGFSNLTGISGGVQVGKTKGTYANVAEQSGIVAGDGGYHVTAGGNVGLIGGVIASTAAPVNNDLTASSLTFSNLENTSKASTSSYGFSLTPGGIPVPSVGQPAKQSDTGAALATLTPGKLTLSNQTQDLESLNTDLSKANDTVKPFDIDKLKAQQQSAAALSELLNIGVGTLSDKLGFDEGSVEKTALHAAVGALVSKLAGGNALTGAVAGAASELANGVLQDVLKANPDLSADQKNAITQWVAATVGALTGGTQGTAAGLDNVNYNYLNHAEAIALKQAQDKCDGGDAASCKEASGLTQLDIQRDAKLHADCTADIAGAACQSDVADLRVALASLYQNNEGLDPVMMHWVELYQTTMTQDLYDPSGVKRAMLNVLAGALLGGGVAAAEAGTPGSAGAANATGALTRSQIEEILNIPSGSRPDPASYMSQAAIDDLLEKFNGGASYITPTSALDTFGRNLVGRPGGQFVMPSTVLDKLLQSSGGDVSVIEQALGIPPGAWQGVSLSRIDIPNPSSVGIRIPSGNEPGANGQWVPGGYTSGGVPEAVTNQIPAGSYIESHIGGSAK